VIVSSAQRTGSRLLAALRPEFLVRWRTRAPDEIRVDRSCRFPIDGAVALRSGGRFTEQSAEAIRLRKADDDGVRHAEPAPFGDPASSTTP